MGSAPPCWRAFSPGMSRLVEASLPMAKPLLMFTWTEVRDALEMLAETSQQRRAICWLLERLKQDSDTLSPNELLVEIINTAILLGARPQSQDGLAADGLPSLLDG